MKLLYEKELEKDVKKYCKANNIPVIGNAIPTSKIREIEGVINNKVRLEKIKANHKEKIRKQSFKYILTEMMGGLKVESPIEEKLYVALKDIGLGKYFETQFHIGAYRVDFAIPSAKLVIEADGRQYHFTEKFQIERDQKRDKYLARRGWRILHLDGLMISRRIDDCLEKIKKLVKPYGLLNNPVNNL
jgi:very-short-patch-repair endonuclease